MTTELQNLIDLAWEGRAQLSATAADPKIREAVEQVIGDLNAGRLRVAERQGVGQWIVNQWVKKAVLLSFRLNDNHVMRAGDLSFFDKVETKFGHVSEDAMRATGIRVVPPAVARRGSYLAKNVVAAGLAKRCVIQVAYAIGVAKPLAIYADTYGTGLVPEAQIEKAVAEVMDLTPRGIRTHLNLNRPIYQRTAAYGHFGRAPDADGGFSWEKTDLVEALKKAV